MPKQGRTLNELAAELTRQSEEKRDFVANTEIVKMVTKADIESPADIDTQIVFQPNGEELRMPIGDIAHGQIAQRLGVPKRFYDRLRQDQPDMLAYNVSELFRREPEQRMLRTLDGRLRAFLSQAFRPLDNAELCEAILPALAEIGGIEIMSCEVTERRLYIKFATTRLEMEAVGQTIRAGGMITNSEVGLGALHIVDWDLTVACLNGMTREKVLTQAHIGRRTGIEGIDASEFFKDDTRAADDKALFLKVRDTITAMFSEERFAKRIESLNTAADRKIEEPIAPAIIEVVNKKLSLADRNSTGILRHLLQSNDLNAYTLANAVTRHSQDVDSYDNASEMETAGGKIIELSKNDWSALVKDATTLHEQRSAA